MNVFNEALSNTSRLLTRCAAKNNLVILTYHRILSQPDPFMAGVEDRATFAWQMSVLSKYYEALPLSVAVDKLYSGTLPRGAVAVTFDDGYADNYHTALPILTEYKIPATIFVATGFLDGGIMWNDQLRESICNTEMQVLDLGSSGLGRFALMTQQDKIDALHGLIEKIKYMEFARRSDFVAEIQHQLEAKTPCNLMMTSEQVKLLSERGIEIGAHTDQHPILSSLTSAQAEQEINTGRDKLHEITGNLIQAFAYPNGRYQQDFSDQHIDLVKNLGFQSAVATAWGSATRDSHRWKLPRAISWDKTPLRFWLRILQCRRNGDPYLRH